MQSVTSHSDRIEPLAEQSSLKQCDPLKYVVTKSSVPKYDMQIDARTSEELQLVATHSKRMQYSSVHPLSVSGERSESQVVESEVEHTGPHTGKQKLKKLGSPQTGGFPGKPTESKRTQTTTLRTTYCFSLFGNNKINSFATQCNDEVEANRNNNCCTEDRSKDETGSARFCGCILCCFCGRSKVTPVGTGTENYPQASVSSMRSRLEASSNYPSCTAVSAIPLKAYSQFSFVGSHPMSQIESVFEGLRKKSVESYAVPPVDLDESMTEVSSTDQLQIEIPVVSQKPFYIL